MFAACFRWTETRWVIPGEPTLFGVEDLEASSLTWPASGIMLSGTCWPLPPLSLPTAANASGCSPGAQAWPTPAAHEFEPTDTERMLARREEIKAQGINGNGFGLTLGMMTGMWPTPNATDGKGPSQPEGRRPECDDDLPSRVEGLWQTPQLPGGGGKCRGQGRGDEALLPGQAEAMGESLELWATPTSHERTHTPRQVDHGEQLANQADQWATPQASENENRTTHNAPSHNGSTHGMTLAGQAGSQADLWATPMIPNGGRTVEGERTEAGREGKAQSGHLEAQVLQTAPLSFLPGLATSPPGGPSSSAGPTSPPLCEAIRRLLARLPAWSRGPLPAKKNAGKNTRKSAPTRTANPKDSTAKPTISESLISETNTLWLALRNRYWRPRLNPAFVTWLMGWPGNWLSLAPTSSDSSAMESWYCNAQRRLSFFCGDSKPSTRPDNPPPCGRRPARGTSRTRESP